MPDRRVRDARRGACVVIAGPDGTGKSTLATGLVHRIGARGFEVRHFHHRLRALPGSAASLRATTTPHAQPPYSRLLSVVKLVYLFADELLGWALKVRPFLRAGGWVVVERGWWDLAVDPRRYRLRSAGGLVRALGRLLPQPDVILILDMPELAVRGRKTELDARELRRQLAAWRDIAAELPHATIVDATRPADEVLAASFASVRFDA